MCEELYKIVRKHLATFCRTTHVFILPIMQDLKKLLLNNFSIN